MKRSTVCITLPILLLLHLFVSIDARNLMGSAKGSKQMEKMNAVKHTLLEQMMAQLNLAQQLDSSSNTQPYGVSSPFTLPPYDSLPPIAFPQNTPPDCENPPNAPQTPGSPSPDFTVPSPPGSSSYPSPPINVPGPSGPALGPPEFEPSPPYIEPGTPITGPSPPVSSSYPNPPDTIPGPSAPVLGPPDSSPYPNPPITVPGPSGPVLGPPEYEPSPPITVPSPTFGTPSPVGFLPPVVFPPPTVPPPPHHASTGSSLWCVAKPSVPDPIIQEAMNYACASGADCEPIQPSGTCFEPNTLWAHASFALNSYWQRSKGAGGSCEFGGTGMLVTIDPSYNGCHFDYY